MSAKPTRMQFSVVLDKADHRKLAAKAKKLDVSLGHLVRQAIKASL